jgi:hypothetical protein
MHPPTTRSTLTNPVLAKAFEAVKAEIFAVPSHALLPIDVDITQSTTQVIDAAKNFTRLLPYLARIVGYDVRPVRRLRFYAGAALYAHLLALTPGPADPQLLATRARAFTLFVQKYQHCRRGVTFLGWPEGSARTYLPRLYKRRRWDGGSDSGKGTAGTRDAVSYERALAPRTSGEEVLMS